VSQYELESQWIKGALPTVKFRFDSHVRASSGQHKGQAGRIVALLSIEPTPLYVVEELDGTSFNATEPELERNDLTKRSS
jgi:ribosomal protein S4E